MKYSEGKFSDFMSQVKKMFARIYSSLCQNLRIRPESRNHKSSTLVY